MQRSNIQKIKKLSLFLLLWLVITVSSLALLLVLGWVPESVRDYTAGIAVALELKEPERPPLPPFSKEAAELIIKKIDLDAPIVFPDSSDMAVLKKSLDAGVVHYPASALPGEDGNVFLFGHSSARRFEANPNRTVFTRLNELVTGDEIIIRSQGVEYRYRVVSVAILKPTEARVYFETAQPQLTLSTCWPVGDPKNRFVVEAEFVGKSLVGEEYGKAVARNDLYTSIPVY